MQAGWTLLQCLACYEPDNWLCGVVWQCSCHTEDAIHCEWIGEVHWRERKCPRVPTAHVCIKTIITTLYSFRHQVCTLLVW